MILTIEDSDIFKQYRPAPGSQLYEALTEQTAAATALGEIRQAMAQLRVQRADLEAKQAALSWASDLDNAALLFGRLPALKAMYTAAETEEARRLHRVGTAAASVNSALRAFLQYSEAIATLEEEDANLGNRGREVRHERIEQARASEAAARRLVLEAA